MAAKLLQFPESVPDVPTSLRNLADAIEAGEYGESHNLAWVLDEGNGVISIGLMGKSHEPGPIAHYLFALGMRRLEDI